VILVDVAGAAPMPWRNGGGVTRELLRLPADGQGDTDDWTLRISVADIVSDGPFSAFAGVTRWFAVLEGPGVRLRWPHSAVHLHPGDSPLCFDGADAPACTLLGAPTRDLNVMARTSKARAMVDVASWRDRERWTASTRGMGFFALQPLRLHGPQDTPVDLPALSLCWQSPPFGPPRPWGIAPAQDSGGGPEHTAGLPGYWISLHEPERPRR
jgi:uncharacterized protein